MRLSVAVWSNLRALALTLACMAAAHAGDKPHIVYLLADDLGWKDVGFHGGSVQTPNLDRLAAAGTVLNALYAQPFSTQTRAALMTGRYPMRYGLQTGTIQPGSQYGLPVEERTLAQALKEAGYATAFLGKWQLGHARPEFWPRRRGFDHFYGSLSGQAEPLLKKTAKADWRRNDQLVREDGYVTALLGREAVGLIGRHDPSRPLLLMLSFAAPSAPCLAPPAFLATYRAEVDDTRRNYAACVSALDHAVGEVVGALEARRMLNDTLIVFHSDSGGALPAKYPTGDADVERAAADNGVFRDGRGSLYEGGVRVVALAAWPGRIKPKTVVTDPVHVTDLHVTLLKLAGAPLDPAAKLDGLDLWPALADGQRGPRKEILINVEDFRGALRAGTWKLVVHAALPSRIELYDLDADPEEVENLAQRYPERVRELLPRLNDYAYDMAPAKYLDEVAGASAGRAPIFWRVNPVRR